MRQLLNEKGQDSRHTYDFWDAIKGTIFTLIIGILLFIIYLFVRADKFRTNFVIRNLTAPYKKMMGWLCDFLPFSVMEFTLLIVGFIIIIFLIRSVFLIFAKPQKSVRIFKTIGGLAAAALLIWDGYCWLWGINYYGSSFSELSGLTDRPISTEELTAAATYYAEEANRLSASVSRNEEGIFNEDLKTIFAASDKIYAVLIDEYPFLNAPHRTPKRMIFSEWMSRTNFTGFYFPFTSETNLNDRSPSVLIPSTIAHELAHQRGIAPEQEANFVAVRACMTSGNNVYAYSGALLAYIHLGNALYEADRTAWESVYNSLSEPVKADLTWNNRYWEEYQGIESKTAGKVYEAFLGSYGQTLGLKSYGACVDLLAIDYFNKSEEENERFLNSVDGIS